MNFVQIRNAHAALRTAEYPDGFATAKAAWKNEGAKLARKLAKDLGGKASWNAGGPAAAGDHSVTGPNCWVELCGMHYSWGQVMYRRASPMDKYGMRSQNQWAELPRDEAAYQELLAKVRAL